MPAKSPGKPKFVPRHRRGAWSPHGTWWTLDAAGNWTKHRGWRSGGYTSRALCQVECERLTAEAEAMIGREAAGIPTFATAAVTYGQINATKKQLHHHLARAVEVIGDLPVNEVDDRAVIRVVTSLYPNGAAPSTLNRHIYTPIIAVLHHAARGKSWRIDISRPSGHSEFKPAEAPDGPEWYRAVLPHCSPNLRALLLFVRLHNRRSGEAMQMLGKNYRDGYLEIPRSSSKIKKAERIQLAEAVQAALVAAGQPKGPDAPLFGYRYSTRRNAWRDLARACRKAGVPMYSLHKAGRHAYSKHHLNEGGSLADLTQLGRWSDPSLPAMLYGAREQNALDATYLPKADAFAQLIMENPAKVAEDSKSESEP